MFDTARESSLSQAISNINAYLLNANTDNLNLLSQKILLVPLPQPIMKAAKNVKFLTFLAAFAHTNKSLCVPMRIKYNISSSSLNS